MSYDYDGEGGYYCDNCESSYSPERWGRRCPWCDGEKREKPPVTYPDNIPDDTVHYSSGVPAKFFAIHCQLGLREEQALCSITRNPYEVTCNKCVYVARMDMYQLEMDIFQFGRHPSFYEISQPVTIPSMYGDYIERISYSRQRLQQQLIRQLQASVKSLDRHVQNLTNLKTLVENIGQQIQEFHNQEQIASEKLDAYIKRQHEIYQIVPP